MNRRFQIHPTSLPGVNRIERMSISDHRGFLQRVFCNDELADAGFSKPIEQINRTLTHQQGTVRGMHFQRPPHAEIKLVSCLRGEIFDVAVDLRQDSPTFLHWHGEVLSEANNLALLIPEGFAHGFQTLSADCEILYCHSASYAPQAEDGVNARDETLAIAWPLGITQLSDRDASLPLITADYRGVGL
jgi:dTDP-4-dehydrorhamnose 3,5-epimerase